MLHFRKTAQLDRLAADLLLHPLEPAGCAQRAVLIAGFNPKREATSRDWIEADHFNRGRGIHLFTRPIPAS